MRAKVTGSVTLQGYSKDTFGDKEQDAFAAGLANILNLADELVTVKVQDARRRLLAAIAVDYEIAVADLAAGVNMQARIKAVISAPADLVDEFKAAGLTEVASAIVTVSDSVASRTAASRPPQPPPSPPPDGLVAEDESSSVGGDRTGGAYHTIVFAHANRDSYPMHVAGSRRPLAISYEYTTSRLSPAFA
jgi:hypothetical protein